MQGWPRLGKVGLPEAKWHKRCPGHQELLEPEDCRWLPALPQGHWLGHVLPGEAIWSRDWEDGEDTGQGEGRH